MARQILQELFPENINKDAGMSTFTPMRNSTCRDVYQAEFKELEAWWESGQFMEALLKEFEKKCQSITL